MPAEYNAVFDLCEELPSDKLAMIWDDDHGHEEHIRWGALQDLSSAYAHQLQEMQVLPGDRVVTVLRQSPEAAAVMLAVLRAGAVLVTMSELWADGQLRQRHERVEPVLTIVEARLSDRVAGLLSGPVVKLEELETSRDCPFPTVVLSADAPAFIGFTSGTTGPAKGVVIPHRSMLSIEEYIQVQDLHEGERYFAIGDWSWWVRKLLGPWKVGAVILVYRYDRFDPVRLLDRLVHHGVRNVFINATALRMIQRDVPDTAPYRDAFTTITSSNEALGAGTATWVRDHLGVSPREMYGSTEMGLFIGARCHEPVKPGSMGKPLGSSVVRVLDETGRQVPIGEPGEICLKAGSTLQYPLGYWGQPEETERDFGGEWFHTKDVAYVDADGYFFYVGRRDDAIKVAGYRIAPHEVEAVMNTHPDVMESALVGIKDPVKGHRLVAYVRLRNRKPSAGLLEELQRLVKTEHAAFSSPKELVVLDELPVSATGKLNRAQLRRHYAAFSESA
ncbi:acyl-CoA synthetase [Leucobacter sp. CSA1]|uniref:Acyl-CoA synthetase n=1 Tax=Leucobacter chromiisoli TaxID=2796471 RepID=A0A934Q753_9MICO|nr:acyl-CoA synthetase [Leucobacter chromiisoli]MBK0418306.1 acyl-CoA synthetase [Leucobacter chromiisoli]